MATLPATLAALLLAASTASAYDFPHQGAPARELGGSNHYSAEVKLRVDKGDFEKEGFPQSIIDAVTHCANKKRDANEPDTREAWNECTRQYHIDATKKGQSSWW